MRKTLLAVLISVLVLSTGAYAQAQIFNGDFEFEDPAAGWNLTGGASVMAPGAWSVPIHSGNFAGLVTSWSGDWAAPSGTAQQAVYGMSPGMQMLLFDYYIGVRSGDAWRTAGIKVKVNGVEVFSEINNAEVQWSGYFPWKTAAVPVTITGDSADIVFEYHAHFAEWSWLAVDNVEFGVIPEPGSMLALAGGLAGFAGMIIRRKRSA